jgi:hypothetical protein
MKFFRRFHIRQDNNRFKLLGIFKKSAHPLSSKLPVSNTSLTKDQEAQREHMRFLANISTSLWRLRQKMVQPGTNHPQDQMLRAFRDLESIWDTMTQAGIKIQDHTGTVYDPGITLRVIAFQPMTGINCEEVIETIKPTIYYKDKPIQMGHVIVGIPETPDMGKNKNLKE